MRQIGSIQNSADAQRFAAYLVTLGISAHAEDEGDSWAVWVRDENHLDESLVEFDAFLAAPTDAKYQGAEEKAEELRRDEAERRQRARENIVEMKGQWRSPNAQRKPLVVVMIGLSVFVFMTSNFGGNSGGTVIRSLAFLNPVHEKKLTSSGELTDEVVVSGDSMEFRLTDILQGQVWRLVTPIFIHYGAMHIIFNMLMLFSIGGQIENRYGTVRFALIVLATAVISNFVQGVMPIAWDGSWRFGGMSGVLYGLFGFMWMKSLFDPSSRLYLSQGTIILLVAWLFAGIFQVLEYFGMHIANWGHAVGLVVGIIIGYFPELIKGASSR